MGAAATIGGVILLAIGLMMVAGGGGMALMELTRGAFSSSSTNFLLGIVLFWIGMVPTVFGVRLIARTKNLDKLQADVDLIKKELNDQLSKQTLSKTEIQEISEKYQEEISKSKDKPENS